MKGNSLKIPHRTEPQMFTETSTQILPDCGYLLCLVVGSYVLPAQLGTETEFEIHLLQYTPWKKSVVWERIVFDTALYRLYRNLWMSSGIRKVKRAREEFGRAFQLDLSAGTTHTA